MIQANSQEWVIKRDMAHLTDTRDFCTVKEAARLSGLALKTWYQGCAGTNTVPRVRFGRSVRLLRKDVEKFIQERIAEAELGAKAVEIPDKEEETFRDL